MTHTAYYRAVQAKLRWVRRRRRFAALRRLRLHVARLNWSMLGLALAIAHAVPAVRQFVAAAEREERRVARARAREEAMS